MDNINFTGGFLLKAPKPQQWEKIYNEIVPKKRVIVNDLKGKDNVFFATKNCYDPSILKYLIENKVKFTFYPKINLKNRIDSYYPEKATEILDAETEVITLKRNMLKYLETPTKSAVKQLKYKWKPEDHIPQTLQALKLDKSQCKISTKNSITTIKDLNDKILAKVSPNNNRGISYALIYPRFGDEKLRMVVTTHKGEIVTDTTDIDKLADFKKHFMHAVTLDLSRQRPKKSS